MIRIKRDTALIKDEIDIIESIKKKYRSVHQKLIQQEDSKVDKKLLNLQSTLDLDNES